MATTVPGSAAPGFPRLSLVSPDADVLPDGVVVRLVGAAPPAALLAAVYGTDAALVLRVLAATDPVLQRAVGGVHLVHPADWPTGPGAGWIVAPFVRAPGPDTASRFSDGSYGVWYGADDLATAQAEVGHHLAAYLAKTGAAPDAFPRTVLHATCSALHPLIDLRPAGAAQPGVLDPQSYAVSQPFGARCRDAHQWGLVWPSVRLARGTCLGVLRPPVLNACADVATCMAVWDGRLLTWA